MSLKDRIKRFAIEYPLLDQAMYWSYRFKNGTKGEAELERRSKSSLFDYQGLSADLLYTPEERVIDNNLYGYAHYFKKFASIEGDLKAYMEHGLFLGRIVHQDQYHWHFPKVITMSEGRREILAEKLPGKKSLAVGPYIHYAPSLLKAEEMHQLKQKLGKTLLVYPFHSMKNVKVGFSDQDLVKEIKRVARDFDSVLISMYYLDAQDEQKCAPYLSEGFKIVCAGHKFDRHFVARQRSHIELADLTMSNGMGTQTGFCVYLNKAHYIYRQDIEQTAISSNEHKRFQQSSGGDEKDLVRFQRDYFARLFSELRDDINKEQYEAVAQFWGFDSIKSPEAIRDFIL